MPKMSAKDLVIEDPEIKLYGVMYSGGKYHPICCVIDHLQPKVYSVDQGSAYIQDAYAKALQALEERAVLHAREPKDKK